MKTIKEYKPIDIVKESFSAFDMEHYHCLLGETTILKEFKNKKFLAKEEVLELIDELKDVVKWKCGTNTDNAMFWNEEIEELKARITG